MEISPGQSVAVVSGTASLSDVLPSLLAIRERLGAPIDVRRSLVENVKRDPEGGVRLQNLLLLLRELPRDPATVEALRAACSDRLPEIRLRAEAAANALGRAGSTAAVLPLKEAAERFPLDLELRIATRQAIAKIQTRAKGASAGQLSLAPDTGQLSLTDEPAGKLSLSGESPDATPVSAAGADGGSSRLK